MAADTLTQPTTGKTPVRWTTDEFRRMTGGGLFTGQKVMLLDGQLWEQHHGDPRFPDPRPHHWSRDQYRRLGDIGLLVDPRTELLFGEIYRMSPIGWPHVAACTKTVELLRDVFKGRAWVSTQNPFAAADSDPQPDVMVVPGQVSDYRDHPDRALLVVEVADATLDYDTTSKAELYATACVADYWVIDLVHRKLIVFRDPMPLPQGLSVSAYRSKRTLGPDEVIAPLAAPQAAVTVADLLP